MRIRRATIEDVETLFEVRTSVKENYESRTELASKGITPRSVAKMLSEEACAWIAELDGVPVAFSMAKGDERTIFAVFVRPEHEAKGLGRAVLAEAEKWLWSGGADEIWLTTGAEPNIRAHGFYERCGWLRTTVLVEGEVQYVKSRPNKAI